MSGSAARRDWLDMSEPLALFQPNRAVRIPIRRPFTLVPQSPEQAQAEFYQGAPDWEEDWPVKIEWMRLRCWTTAMHDALADALGVCEETPNKETIELIEAMCATLGYPESTVQTLMNVVWPDVRKRAHLIVEQAERAARRLIFEAASGKRVIDAATAVFDRHEAYVPQEWLIAMCARLAQTRGRRRGG